MPTMKEVELKTLTTESGTFDYRQTLLDIMRMPRDPQRGADDDEMDMLLSIRRQIREAKQIEGKPLTVLLTEEHFKELAFRVDRFRPSMVIEEVRDFKNDIKESKSVEVAPVQTA